MKKAQLGSNSLQAGFQEPSISCNIVWVWLESRSDLPRFGFPILISCSAFPNKILHAIHRSASNEVGEDGGTKSCLMNTLVDLVTMQARGEEHYTEHHLQDVMLAVIMEVKHATFSGWLL